MVKKKGRARRGANVVADDASAKHREDETLKKSPHTFVFNRGKVGKNVGRLIRDMRQVFEPFTASKLKVRKKNVLKDFVSVAGVLNVSHLVMFSKSAESVSVRVCRVPRGPTLTFRVRAYSLSRDIATLLKRPQSHHRQFGQPPLLVMSGLSGEGLHFKLMASMFQNMFPAINVHKVRLRDIRRCVVLHYDSDTSTIEFRHYNIRAVPVGMSRGIKKLIRAKVPDLGRYQDMSNYLTATGDLSESEAELDGPHNEVVLPQELGSRGNIRAAKSAIRLTEIGPRMTLELVKIEEGVCSGEVLHHSYVTRTPAEVELLRQMRAEKAKLKEKRQAMQNANIERKREAKEQHKASSFAGMKRASDDAAVVSDDDDAAYYKAEVGEEPDVDLFPVRRTAKRRKVESAATGRSMRGGGYQSGEADKTKFPAHSGKRWGKADAVVKKKGHVQKMGDGAVGIKKFKGGKHMHELKGQMRGKSGHKGKSASRPVTGRVHTKGKKARKR